RVTRIPPMLEVAVRSASPRNAALFIDRAGMRLDVFDSLAARRTIVDVIANPTRLYWRPVGDEILYLAGIDRVVIQSTNGASRDLGIARPSAIAWMADGSGVVYAPGFRSRTLRTVAQDGRGDRELWRTDLEPYFSISGVWAFNYR